MEGTGMKRVLVVEDEVLQREALMDKFQRSGFVVSAANDGEEAIQLLHEGDNGYDVVILDLILPKMDGYTVLENMQQNHIEVPVVVLSALGQQEEKARAEAFGIKAYFVKTDTTLEEVIGFVKGLLAEGN